MTIGIAEYLLILALVVYFSHRYRTNFFAKVAFWAWIAYGLWVLFLAAGTFGLLVGGGAI
jgi:hypothetical protein